MPLQVTSVNFDMPFSIAPVCSCVHLSTHGCCLWPVISVLYRVTALCLKSDQIVTALILALQEKVVNLKESGTNLSFKFPKLLFMYMCISLEHLKRHRLVIWNRWICLFQEAHSTSIIPSAMIWIIGLLIEIYYWPTGWKYWLRNNHLFIGTFSG